MPKFHLVITKVTPLFIGSKTCVKLLYQKISEEKDELHKNYTIHPIINEMIE